MARGTTEAREAGSGQHAWRALWITLCALAVLLGVVLILTGAGIYVTAHTVTPVRIEGRVADYKEILVNGAYARNELMLTGDPHTYVLDQGQFNPKLPERLYQDTRATIWVDGHSTTVIAITLYDVMGLNPVTYTTGAYDNPESAMLITQAEGIGAAGLGLALLVLVPAWAFISGRRRRARAGAQATVDAPAASPASAPSPARTASPMPAPAPMPFITPTPRSAQANPTSVEDLPTQRTPAIQPQTSGPHSPAAYPTPRIPAAFDLGPGDASLPPVAASGASWDERGTSAPPAPSAPFAAPLQSTNDIGELPTQHTPSVPSTPSTPSSPSAPSAPSVPSRPLWPPDEPRRMLPRFGPGAWNGEPNPPNWGVPWGVAPDQASAPSSVPQSPRPMPTSDAPRPAEDDVEELPTERMPAQQPPRDVEEMPTQKTPSISPPDND